MNKLIFNETGFFLLYNIIQFCYDLKLGHGRAQQNYPYSSMLYDFDNVPCYTCTQTVSIVVVLRRSFYSAESNDLYV